MAAYPPLADAVDEDRWVWAEDVVFTRAFNAAPAEGGGRGGGGGGAPDEAPALKALVGGLDLLNTEYLLDGASCEFPKHRAVSSVCVQPPTHHHHTSARSDEEEED